jgi:hypothetical protein
MASYLEEAGDGAPAGGERCCAHPGGVDSAVVAALLQRAIGEQLVAVFVDTGLLRQGERLQVEQSLRQGLGFHALPASRIPSRSARSWPGLHRGVRCQAAGIYPPR